MRKLSVDIQQVFNLTQDELEIIFWTKYWAIHFEIEKSKINLFHKMIRSEEHNLNKEKKLKKLKKQWLKEWHDITRQLLNIENKIGITDLEDRILQSKFIGQLKSLILIVECATFSPYFPLAKNDKRFKNLKFDVKNYFLKLEYIFPVTQEKLLECRNEFNKSFKKISKDVVGHNNILIWTTLAAVVTLLLAPWLAGEIGAVLFGLHGAAATSAGLAFLGGGALAVGGFGMAGGTIVIMAGGVIIGYGTGNKLFKSEVKKLSSEELLLSCTKVTSFLGVLDNPLKTEMIRGFCDSSRSLQHDLEKQVDDYFLNNNSTVIKKNKERVKQLKRKPATLVAFRKYIRQL